MLFEDGFQEIYHGVMLTDIKGRISACNRAARELLNVNEEVLGKQIEEVFPDPKVYEVLETGNSLVNNRVNVSGKLMIAHYKPVIKEEKLIGMAISFQGITEYETVAQELEGVKELNRELEAIFNFSYDEIYVTDGQGITLRVNKACERFYGVKAEEIIGKHVGELEKQGLFSPGVSPQVLKEKKRITSIQNTKSGQRLVVTANPVFDEKGEIIRVVTNSRDITELSNLRQRLEETEKLMEVYRSEIAQLLTEKTKSTELIGDSPTIKNIIEMAKRVASVDSTVLIQGESGVGKGVIASKIHQLSQRSKKAFITINCGAIPESLIESELFGYEGGAFTGAKKEGKQGLLETANGGTVFFDEIGELPLNVQVKLLHVIQEKRFLRVGGNSYIDVDIRIVAATNRDMQSLIKERKFREDLFYRLNVVPIVIPPLRHRKEDIPNLLEFFLQSLCNKYQLNKRFATEAIELLCSYSWPGNVRELENLVERLVVTTDSYEITQGHLPDYFLQVTENMEKVMVLEICPLKKATEEVERQLLTKAYAKYRNTYRMAEILDVNQSTIVRKLHRLEIGKETKELSKD